MKNIIVTGANQGIGYGIVEKLANKSAYNIIMACRNLGKANEARQKIMNTNPDSKITVEELDVSDESSINNFYKKLAQRSFKVDVLVNNAGAVCPMNSDDYSVAKKIFQTNFYGPIKLTDILMPLISQQGRILFSGGYIGKLSQIKNEKIRQILKNKNLTKEELFNFANEYLEKAQNKSLAAEGLPKWFYTASKIGINYYPQILAKTESIKQKNISTYSYCPGWTKTQMTGFKGKQSIEEGTVTPIFLIQLSPQQCKPEQQGHFFQKCAISSLN